MYSKGTLSTSKSACPTEHNQKDLLQFVLGCNVGPSFNLTESGKRSYYASCKTWV